MTCAFCQQVPRAEFDKVPMCSWHYLVFYLGYVYMSRSA
jgi:hypothetical protein